MRRPSIKGPRDIKWAIWWALETLDFQPRGVIPKRQTEEGGRCKPTTLSDLAKQPHRVSERNRR